MIEKVCSCCGESKLISEYYNNGKFKRCRTCVLDSQREYDRTHKQEKLDYLAERRRTSKHTRVLDAHRALLYKAIKAKCIYVSPTLEKQIGCSLMTLRHHLEDRFRPGMSWDNYGNDGWVLDHIRACALFDLRFKKYQKMCFNYTNFQPLWYSENQRKATHES